MPEISDAELRQYVHYQNLGTPAEVQKKIDSLETDNKSQRDEIRRLKEAQVQDGHIVVPEDDAKLLAEYKELGKPKEIKDKIAAGEEAQGKLTLLSRKDAARNFVKVAGLAEDAIETLVAIPALAGAELEVREVKAKDSDEKELVPYIKLPNEDKAMTFAEAQEKVPALKGLRPAEPAGKDTGGPGVKFINQGEPNTGGKPGETIYDKIRREAKEREEARQEQLKARPEKSVEERLGMVPRA